VEIMGLRLKIVATQFLTHILINFQIKNKKNNNKIIIRVYMWR
jgi:hypothetical protein